MSCTRCTSKSKFFNRNQCQLQRQIARQVTIVRSLAWTSIHPSICLSVCLHHLWAWPVRRAAVHSACQTFVPLSFWHPINASQIVPIAHNEMPWQLAELEECVPLWIFTSFHEFFLALENRRTGSHAIYLDCKSCKLMEISLSEYFNDSTELLIEVSVQWIPCNNY